MGLVAGLGATHDFQDCQRRHGPVTVLSPTIPPAAPEWPSCHGWKPHSPELARNHLSICICLYGTAPPGNLPSHTSMIDRERKVLLGFGGD